MPENKIVRVGVGCWIQNPSGQFLFGHRLSKHGNGTWAPPGGHLEYGETPEQCAARELLEETGILRIPDDFKIIGVTNDIFADKHYVTIHCGEKLTFLPKPFVQEPDKCSMWQWFDLNRLPDNLFLPAKNFLVQMQNQRKKDFFTLSL